MCYSLHLLGVCLLQAKSQQLIRACRGGNTGAVLRIVSDLRGLDLTATDKVDVMALLLCSVCARNVTVFLLVSLAAW